MWMFVLGFVIGILFTLAFSTRKEFIMPGKKTRLIQVLEKHIVSLKDDINVLEDTNDELRKELSELRNK